MDSKDRFEILSPIASGDYATVYRARDRELGREVAIKQIHPQFLQDPKQLERYWREAQLLASLEHPHIMTIYDIVRERGWLVLELMQGSLQQLLGGRPIDLNDLRMAITYTANALKYMHEHGIVHGDVKPSNLLVDKNHRVKLGDFGIARRLAGEHGSVVKGTTKYMAPEVVSDQFGPVGPHSDIYSLGFSAYELLCGENFETLFPGLNMFGRDQQVAWMMWHSAPDRKLPDIDRVLAGVPKDLAYVIQRMIEKDPARRYRSIDQMLEDLRKGTTAETALSPEEEAAQEAAERRAKRKRRMAIGASVVSIMLSLSVAFWPTPKPPPKAPPVVVRPTTGLIGEIDLDRGIFFLRQGAEDDSGAAPVGVTVEVEQDRVFVNEQRATLADLRTDDQIEIKYLVGDGVEFKEIYAARPEENQATGTVQAVDATAATLALNDASGMPIDPPWYVPTETLIAVNGERHAAGRTLQLADLRPNDRVTVSYILADDNRPVARSITALRTLTANGSLVSRNPQQSRLVMSTAAAGGGAAASGAAAGNLTMIVSRECVVMINGQDKSGDAPLTIADLNVGDTLVVTYDSVVHRIEASRQVTASGVLAEVNLGKRTFTITTGEPPRSVEFALGATCPIIGPQQAALDFEFLRRGDAVDVEFSALSSGVAQAEKVVVRPASDPRSWAVVLSESQHDDARLSPLPHAAADAEAVRHALLDRYRIPNDQLLVLPNASRLQIEQGLSTFLPKVPADAQLIGYCIGHAYADTDGAVYFAPKEYDSQRPGPTGVGLKWLVKQFEGAAAREKILLLDTSHAGSGDDLKSQPSAAEQAESVKERPHRPVSTSVLVIAACQKDQRGLTTDGGASGVFGSAIAAAFTGAADGNRDGQVTAPELLDFLPRSMTKLAGDGRAQTPAVFPPDASPPRLTVEARDAVRKLLGHLRDTRFDDSLTITYQTMIPLAPRQPDISLAYGLLLLRHTRTPLSRPVLEKIRQDHPNSVVVHQALAWQDFLQGRLPEGVTSLRLMVETLPNPAEDQASAAYVDYSLKLAGSLRQFALTAAEPPLALKDVEALDRAVIARGERASAAYRQGVESVRDGVAKLDEQLKDATADRRSTLLIDRKKLTHYATLNYALVADQMLRMLED